MTSNVDTESSDGQCLGRKRKINPPKRYSDGEMEDKSGDEHSDRDDRQSSTTLHNQPGQALVSVSRSDRQSSTTLNNQPSQASVSVSRSDRQSSTTLHNQPGQASASVSRSDRQSSTTLHNQPSQASASVLRSEVQPISQTPLTLSSNAGQFRVSVLLFLCAAPNLAKTSCS